MIETSGWVGKGFGFFMIWLYHFWRSGLLRNAGWFLEDEAVIEKEIIISGGDYGFFFLKDEAVVEKKIDNHNDNGVKGESASSKNEFIGKWKMEGATDIVGKIVKWGEHAEKLGETRSDEKSE